MIEPGAQLRRVGPISSADIVSSAKFAAVLLVVGVNSVEEALRRLWPSLKVIVPESFVTGEYLVV